MNSRTAGPLAYFYHGSHVHKRKKEACICTDHRDTACIYTLYEGRLVHRT